MTTQCPKCLGEGLIGVGENPHLKLGKISTCDVCNGSGQVDANAKASQVAPEPVNAPIEAPVDNSTLSSTPSIDSANGGEISSSADVSSPAEQSEVVAE